MLLFRILSSGSSRQVAIEFKWLLTQVTLYIQFYFLCGLFVWVGITFLHVYLFSLPQYCISMTHMYIPSTLCLPLPLIASLTPSPPRHLTRTSWVRPQPHSQDFHILMVISKHSRNSLSVFVMTIIQIVSRPLLYSCIMS